MIPYEEAISLLNKSPDPIEKICSSSAYWIPLQWAYVAVLKNKDIEPLREFPGKEKLFRFVKNQRPDKISIDTMWVLDFMAEACYVYKHLK